jgi:hypothetical protein
MPRTVEYRAEGAHLLFHGIVTGEDLFDVNERVLEHDYPGRPRYALLDFSDAQRIDVTPQDLQRVAEQDQRDAERVAGIAVLIIAPQTLTFGLARMWEGMVDEIELDSGVVRSRAEAARWLAARGIPLA